MAIYYNLGGIGVRHVILAVILIFPYLAIITFIRYKLTDYPILNEDYPYNHSYYTFSIFGNIYSIFIYFVVLSAMFIFPSFNRFVGVILVLVKMHIYLFIDKFDKYFGWNILKYEYVNKIEAFELLFGCLVVLISSYDIIFKVLST